MNKVIKEIRTIRVAAVQVESRPGQIAANHAHVMPFIETAVSQGAQLVILPELFACGYIPNPTVWRYGESLAGQTVQWLRARENLLSIPTLYARLLGVPVLFANALGDLQPMSGLFGKLMDPALFRLLGLSRIVDGDGTLRGELGHEEGVLVAEVSLGAGFRQEQAPPDYGGWLHPGSALVRRALRPVDLALARAYYALSRQRRRQARRLMAHESIKV
jgi:predicted amidohydrolase